jgi:prolyl-tRNA synthetase
LKLSRFFLPTLKESPSDADALSAKLMIRAGLIRKVASGLYEWLPLGLRVLKKVENIIREEMNRIGGLEVWLPHIQPKELWEETGRWAVYGKELLRLKDRKDAEFCFAPTAEEVITDLARREVRSYRELPLMLYQFGAKFRDEIRPRFGVMRAREFYMKDAYSFHIDEKDAQTHYAAMLEGYQNIFKRCGLKFRPVEADSGLIGGSFSHEFMVLAETGEEEIVSCEACDYAANKERADCPRAPGDPCPRCGSKVAFSRGIEVGHTFKLGTKYSAVMGATYLDEKGQKNPFVMGCYGIGVSRVVAAAIEQNHDDQGILWPLPIAPFSIIITPINFDDPKTKEAALDLYSQLTHQGISVLLDDRPERAGVKFKDADLIGIPLRVVIGEKGLNRGQLEIKERKNPTATEAPLGEAVSRLLKLLS